ncbi:hypothetical protein BS17DRAFT_774085 [Gyrodon lividus]|nr:hypothetical protein BS17DRAFT_774085 [Gyrodon lividus]
MPASYRKPCWVIARPHVDDLHYFSGRGVNSSPFLQAAKLPASSPEFKQFQAELQLLAKKYLDMTKPFSVQEKCHVEHLMRKVPRVLPWVKSDYEDMWPVPVYLTRYLRNTKRHPRRRQQSYSRTPSQVQESGRSVGAV